MTYPEHEKNIDDRTSHSETFPAAESVDIEILPRPTGTPRRYAITAPLHDLHFERTCTLVEMLEDPTAAVAPPGSLLLSDSDCGTHGLLHAEKLDDGGWLLTGST